MDSPGLGGVAFDAQGNLYVASFNAGFIEKYSSSPPETFALVDPLASILGIAFDASGNLYAASRLRKNPSFDVGS